MERERNDLDRQQDRMEYMRMLEEGIRRREVVAMFGFSVLLLILAARMA